MEAAPDQADPTRPVIGRQNGYIWKTARWLADAKLTWHAIGRPPYHICSPPVPQPHRSFFSPGLRGGMGLIESKYVMLYLCPGAPRDKYQISQYQFTITRLQSISLLLYIVAV